VCKYPMVAFCKLEFLVLVHLEGERRNGMGAKGCAGKSGPWSPCGYSPLALIHTPAAWGAAGDGTHYSLRATIGWHSILMSEISSNVSVISRISFTRLSSAPNADWVSI